MPLGNGHNASGEMATMPLGLATMPLGMATMPLGLATMPLGLATMPLERRGKLPTIAVNHYSALAGCCSALYTLQRSLLLVAPPLFNRPCHQLCSKNRCISWNTTQSYPVHPNLRKYDTSYHTLPPELVSNSYINNYYSKCKITKKNPLHI